MTPNNAVSLKGERMLSVRETAQIMGWCLDSVRRHLRAGQMPGVRLGRNWRVPESQLAAYIGLKKPEAEPIATPVSAFAPSARESGTKQESDGDVVKVLLRTSVARTQVLEMVQSAMKNTDASPEVAQDTLKELGLLLRQL